MSDLDQNSTTNQPQQPISQPEHNRQQQLEQPQVYQQPNQQLQQQPQQQPQQQWYYNQQTGKWYDIYGRQYVENTEQQQQNQYQYQGYQYQPENQIQQQGVNDFGQSNVEGEVEGKAEDQNRQIEGEGEGEAREEQDHQRDQAFVFENKEAKNFGKKSSDQDGDQQNYYQGYDWKNYTSKKSANAQNFQPNYNVKQWHQQQRKTKQNEVIKIDQSLQVSSQERAPRSFQLGQIRQGDRLKSVQQIQENQNKNQTQKQQERQKHKEQKNHQTMIFYQKQKQQKEQKLKFEQKIEKQLQASRQRQKELQIEIQKAKNRAIQIEKQNERLKRIQEEKDRKLREKQKLESQKIVVVKKQEEEQKQEKVQKKEKKQKKSKKSKQNKDQSNKKQVLAVTADNAEKKQSQPKVESKVGSESQSSILPARSGSAVVVPAVSSSAVEPVAQPEIQPIFIIKQAQKQRIQGTLKIFLEYMGKHNLNIANQKAVYLSIYEQIDRRKGAKYVWYHFLKEYLSQNQSICKSFHEDSYKIPKYESVMNTNPHLNIAEQLKTGIDQLIFLRKDNGNNYNRFNQYIESKVNIQLQIAFNKYINDLNKTQAQCNEKKKRCLELQQNLKKFVQKLRKVYEKGKQGKQQDQDVFVETCKFIQIQKEFRNSLVVWGRGIIQLKKMYVHVEQRLNDQIQAVLNLFKTAQSNVYGFQPPKFEKIISSKQQVTRQSKYGKLATLSASDYIKYTLQIMKKATLNISGKDFEYFTQMPHFQIICGKSTDLLKGMINKSFHLKEKNEQLINTISGNLVYFNRESSEYKDKFIIKNLQANIVAEGVIQFDEVIPGIIFNDNRSIRVSFKDQDRAEQLICLLNQKI